MSDTAANALKTSELALNAAAEMRRDDVEAAFEEVEVSFEQKPLGFRVVNSNTVADGASDVESCAKVAKLDISADETTLRLGDCVRRVSWCDASGTTHERVIQSAEDLASAVELAQPPIMLNISREVILHQADGTLRCHMHVSIQHLYDCSTAHCATHHLSTLRLVL